MRNYLQEAENKIEKADLLQQKIDTMEDSNPEQQEKILELLQLQIQITKLLKKAYDDLD